jgi:exocyst complex component 4
MYQISRPVCLLLHLNQTLTEIAVPTIAPEDSSNRTDPSEPVLSPAMSPDPSNAVAGPGPSSRFSRYLSSLAVRPAPDQMMDQLGSDLSNIASQASIDQAQPDSQHSGGLNTDTVDAHNPEADSYRYIEVVLEALFVLGKLGGALETVSQRVSTEIHHLIEATLDEVEER